MIYETRSIAHRLTVGVGRDYDVEVILDTEEVGGLVNEAEHFVDEIMRDVVHRMFTGLVDAGGYRMRWWRLRGDEVVWKRYDRWENCCRMEQQRN